VTLVCLYGLPGVGKLTTALAETIRLATFEAAARENVSGLIFTPPGPT